MQLQRQKLPSTCPGAGDRFPAAPRPALMRGSSSSLDQRHHTAPIQQRGQGRGGVAQPVRAVVAYVDAKEPESDLAIFSIDPQLASSSRDHLEYRWRQYTATKARIEDAAGSLLDFAKGAEHFGFTRDGDALVYREWAPAAQAAALIGDFNNWQPTWLTKDEWGVWSVRLPDGPDGQPAVPHGSRVKVRLQSPDGWWADRLPAWVRWATVQPGVMGAKYDGIHWDPPAAERHQWRNKRPAPPRSLRVYEAHVGMSSEDPKVASYREFADEVLPRIKRQGYTAVQLMAIQEHAYYASFGYHVTNPFAVSSRSGTPEDLKYLVDTAHGMGIQVLLDVVHSHISKNQEDGLAGFDLGQSEDMNYFCSGAAGYQSAWDSRCLAYKNWEVQRYLLSNLRFWIEEYQFDGFRFDGVTSMLYQHHGINTGFSGHYHEYFGPQTNVDACVYLMLANEMLHQLLPQVVTIAEDVSGMPALCRPVAEGGLGFDYRLGMAIPDKWIKLLKEVRDEHWGMMDIVTALCNRRYTERTVGYAESHDQALVGDKTIAMWLMNEQMYTNMSTLQPATPEVSRGMALHKMIRMITMALGGEGWLNFMGNEFGHLEWIDFPREGNNWSHAHCRRQWSLADAPELRYGQLLAWDAAMQALDDQYGYLSSSIQWVTHIDEERKVIVAERGPLLFVFNWHTSGDYAGLKVAVPQPGKYRVALDSDARQFGGAGRIGKDADHFSSPEPQPFHERAQSIQVLAPARTAVAYYRVDEAQEQQSAKAMQQSGTNGVAAGNAAGISGTQSSKSAGANAAMEL